MDVSFFQMEDTCHCQSASPPRLSALFLWGGNKVRRESSGLDGSYKFALDSTLEFGLSLLEVNEIESCLRKRNRKVLYLVKIHLFRKYLYSLHLNLATVDIFGENSLLWGCRVHCRMFSSIAGLYSLDTNKQIKGSSDIARCPLGGRVTPC